MQFIKHIKPIKKVGNATYTMGERDCTVTEKVKKPVLDSANIRKLESILENMRYGNVTIFVQDGKIVQMEKTEKYRMT